MVFFIPMQINQVRGWQIRWIVSSSPIPCLINPVRMDHGWIYEGTGRRRRGRVYFSLEREIRISFCFCSAIRVKYVYSISLDEDVAFKQRTNNPIFRNCINIFGNLNNLDFSYYNLMYLCCQWNKKSRRTQRCTVFKRD